MIAASINLALGNAGLMLMLASMTFGALSTAFSIRTGNTRTLRLAPRYAWLGLAGAVLAVVMMQRALITRDDFHPSHWLRATGICHSRTRSSECGSWISWSPEARPTTSRRVSNWKERCK